MSIPVELDLKDILLKIDSKIDNLQKDVIDLKIGQTKIEGKIETLDARIKNVETITGKIPDITEKIGEQKTWRTIIVTAITALVSGVIGWFLRGFRT
jgi:predicted nuclease with TOPRIM domain